MLQVIKAEDVRDGEPRWYCADQRHADEQIRDGLDGPLHLTDRGKEWFASWPLAIVDRPAPSAAIPANRFDCAKCGQAVKADEDGCCATCGRDCTIVVDGAQPPPVLDLDALAEAERAMTAGAWRANIFTTHVADSTQETQWHEAVVGSDVVCETECSVFEDETAIGAANIRGIVALRNAAPHLIAEARAAVALRIDKAALVKLIDENPSLRIRECADLRAEISRLRADRAEFKAWWDLTAKDLTEAREKLAEAKRLGLEAVKLSRDAIEAARMAPVDEPAATVVAIGCLNAADRIAAALEAL